VVLNVISALTSNQMTQHLDRPATSSNYFLTVMYKKGQVKSIEDLKASSPRREHHAAQHLATG
jgi:hypothetical protein